MNKCMICRKPTESMIVENEECFYFCQKHYDEVKNIGYGDNKK